MSRIAKAPSQKRAPMPIARSQASMVVFTASAPMQSVLQAGPYFWRCFRQKTCDDEKYDHACHSTKKGEKDCPHGHVTFSRQACPANLRPLCFFCLVVLAIAHHNPQNYGTKHEKSTDDSRRKPSFDGGVHVTPPCCRRRLEYTTLLLGRS